MRPRRPGRDDLGGGGPSPRRRRGRTLRGRPTGGRTPLTPLKTVDMRIVAAWFAVLTFPAVTAAQTPDSARCYDFRAPLFWRVAWNAERRAWARDTTSIVQLTSRPHPPGAMVRPNDRLVVTSLPHADSVIGGWRVTSWHAPDRTHVTINWFIGGAAYVIEAKVHGDSLVGQLTNHADRVDPTPQVFRVAGIRAECPLLATPSD